MKRWHPFSQLFISRLREFYREPEAIFWVYGFPILLAVGLGIAFSGREPAPPTVDVAEVPSLATQANAILQSLQADGLTPERHDAEACRQRLRTGKTDLYVVPTPRGFDYVYDATRQESVVARCRA